MGRAGLPGSHFRSTLKATLNRMQQCYTKARFRHQYFSCDPGPWIARSRSFASNLNHMSLRAFTTAETDLFDGKLQVNQASLRTSVESLSFFSANQTAAKKQTEDAQQKASHGNHQPSILGIVDSASGAEVSSFDSESSADDSDDNHALSLLKADSIESDITLFGKLGKSEAAISIYQILSTTKWSSPETEGKLSAVVSKLSPELVVEVIKLLRTAPVALSFLNWAKNQEGYKPRAEAYTHIIARFGRERDFNCAWSLLLEMKGCKLPIDFTFSIFLHRVKRAKRVQGVVKAMCGMAFLGVTPTIALYTSALEFLLKVGAIDDAMHLYKQMMQNPLVPDKKLFEVLLVGFLKLGKIDDGLLLFRDMKNRGYEPHVSVYSELISSLSRAKMPDKGKELFKEMLGMGYIPKLLGVDELACALYGEDRADSLEMVLKLIGKTPYKRRIQSHNNLLQCLLDCGRYTEAKSVFENVPRDKAAYSFPRKFVVDYWNLNSYTIYIMGLCKLGQLSLAIGVFKGMLERGVEPTIEISSFLLLSLTDAKMIEEALAICKHVTEGRRPISVDAQKSFFSALRNSGRLSIALKIFASMKRKGCVDEHADFVSLIGLENNDNRFSLAV